MSQKTLTECCDNCGNLIWHNSLMSAPTAACTHPLMKTHKKCTDLKMCECLFWIKMPPITQREIESEES